SNDAHALLGVIGSMGEGQAGAGKKLNPLEKPIDTRLGLRGKTEDEAVDQVAHHETNHGRDDQGEQYLGDTREFAMQEKFRKAPNHMIHAHAHHDGPSKAAHQGMG
ncbi:MAG: hypothetical protein WBJ41_05335, partial [Chromatiaceae bacterium]